jgi:hypothetical protein
VFGEPYEVGSGGIPQMRNMKGWWRIGGGSQDFHKQSDGST